jgi:hypothetical protein
MSRRTLARAGALALGAAVAAATVVPALADPAQPAQSNATLRAIGGLKFKANRFVSDTQRFSSDVVDINSGGRLTVRDRTGQPHSFSLVKRSQVPRNGRQMERCFGPGPCDEIAVDHGAVNPETGEEQDPTEPLVNKGPAGFNRPGDSVVIAPRRKATVRVTGNKDLFYICAIHPWMQGRLNVD